VFVFLVCDYRRIAVVTPENIVQMSKSDIVSAFARDKNDTGSTEVQIALLSRRIKVISGHLQKATHDFHSRNGLLKLIGSRRRFMAYLERESSERYRALKERLGL
jgi:small subunit ribosomal protein S15